MKRRPAERLCEELLRMAALTSVVAVALIFGFIAREAATGSVGELASLFRRSGPHHVWQPVGREPKLDVLPLFVGTLKITVMAIAAPIAVAGALGAAELVSARLRGWLAPVVELVAGVPSVVIGLVVSMSFAPAFQALVHATYATNALVAAFALSFAVAPVIFSVTLDGLLAVPRELRESGYALGATARQTALWVVLPAALPSVMAALTLGFGRAIGETMIVLMTSGNAAVADVSPLSGARAVTATIAAELGETEQGSAHWRALFFLGFVLVASTFLLETGGRALARSVGRRKERIA